MKGTYQMKPRTAMLTAAGLFVAAGSIEFAALPAYAWTSNFTLTARCVDSQTWIAHYESTASNPEFHPLANIADSNVPIAGAPGSWSTDFQVSTATSSFRVKVHFYWSNGETMDVGPKTVHRPDDCSSPTTTPTTTGVREIPTTAPPTAFDAPTTAPPPPTTVADTPTTAPAPTAPVPLVPRTTVARPPTTVTRTALPPTGSEDDILAGVGIGALFIGAVLWLYARLRGGVR